MPSKLPAKLAFIDTETTGTNPSTDRIIEIAIIQTDHDQIIDTFQTLINPECFISPFIGQITGINSNDLLTAPIFADIHQQILDFLDGYLFVAHNARFDYSFIKNEFDRLGKKFTAPTLCTVKFSRLFFPQHHRHNLDSIIKRHNLSMENRHRAFDDAKAIFDFYQMVKTASPKKSFSQKLNQLLHQKVVPPHLDITDINQIPETAGVYIFYGDNKTPLYVGKSKNLKTRIISHFQDSLNNGRELTMLGEIKSIETINTAGEFGALLLESSLIKKLMPLHNRLLRQANKMIAVKTITTKDGYSSVVLEPLLHPTADDLTATLGVFRSKRQAQTFLSEICQEHQLCPKLLGLDNSPTACFAYHLDQCRGACLNQEKSSIYNLRFLLAFQKHAFPKWPYQNPIIITETNQDRSLTQQFLVDHWQLLASSPLNQPLERDVNFLETNFDLDTYKIIRSYLRSKHSNFSINPL